MLMLLFMKQADTLNPKEWSSIRQHNCLIKLKGKRAGYVKNTRNVVVREDRAKDCQAIEELRRICCEETDKARQLKIDEPSMQQRERILLPCISFWLRFRTLQDKVTSLNDAREFYNPETASSSGVSHVPCQPLSIPNRRGLISRDSCLAAGFYNTNSSYYQGSRLL